MGYFEEARLGLVYEFNANTNYKDIMAIINISKDVYGEIMTIDGSSDDADVEILDDNEIKEFMNFIKNKQDKRKNTKTLQINKKNTSVATVNANMNTPVESKSDAIESDVKATEEEKTADVKTVESDEEAESDEELEEESEEESKYNNMVLFYDLCNVDSSGSEGNRISRVDSVYDFIDSLTKFKGILKANGLDSSGVDIYFYRSLWF